MLACFNGRSINANAAELPWFHDASDAFEVEQVGGGNVFPTFPQKMH